MSLRTKHSLSVVALLLAALFPIACARPFRAASASQQVPGSPNEATASTAGVTFEVEVDAWNGDPITLNTVLTPVKVSISNEGPHAVSLRYRNFTLKNPDGISSSALPPFEIRGSTNDPSPVIAPNFRYRNFMAYPNYRFYGPRFRYWADDWGWDPAWYNSNYGYWQRDLPTADMLRKAIPEGVLNPGGSVEGYVYFQRVPDKTPAVELQVNLMDARSHTQFGTIRVPFEREGS